MCFFRLSREEKQYNRALEQAMSESKCSRSLPLVTSSNQSREKDKDYRDSQNTSHASDSDFYSPDQTLDSDDDFQPSPKPKRAKISTPKKGNRTTIKTGNAKVKTNVNAAVLSDTTATVQCMQLPGTNKVHQTLSSDTSRADIIKANQLGMKRSNPSKCSPQVRGSRPGMTGRGHPIRLGSAPVIRVGLSRRAPVKQLHKPNVT